MATWGWSEKSHKSWAVARAKGRSRFILEKGLLTWGGTMFVIMACAPVFFGVPYRTTPSAWYWVWQPALWASGGLVWGIAVWYTMEWQYKKHEARTAQQAPAPSALAYRGDLPLPAGSQSHPGSAVNTVADASSKRSWLLTARNIASGLVGAAIGSYGGIYTLMPLAFTVAVWSVGKRLLSGKERVYLLAIAVQAGQMLWLSLALLYPATPRLDFIDVAVFLVGLTWLTVKPSRGPILLLTVYQVMALAINAATIAALQFGTGPHKALVVHIAWRVLGLFLMWQAYARSRKARSSDGGRADPRAGDDLGD